MTLNIYVLTWLRVAQRRVGRVTSWPVPYQCMTTLWFMIIGSKLLFLADRQNQVSHRTELFYFVCVCVERVQWNQSTFLMFAFSEPVAIYELDQLITGRCLSNSCFGKMQLLFVKYQTKSSGVAQIFLAKLKLILSQLSWAMIVASYPPHSDDSQSLSDLRVTTIDDRQMWQTSELGEHQ